MHNIHDGLWPRGFPAVVKKLPITNSNSAEIHFTYNAIGFDCFAGFNGFFTRLGYRCQTYIDFLQYLECGVYKLTPDIVLLFIHELPDTESNVELKWQLLSKLSHVRAFNSEYIRITLYIRN